MKGRTRNKHPKRHDSILCSGPDNNSIASSIACRLYPAGRHVFKSHSTPSINSQDRGHRLGYTAITSRDACGCMLSTLFKIHKHYRKSTPQMDTMVDFEVDFPAGISVASHTNPLGRIRKTSRNNVTRDQDLTQRKSPRSLTGGFSVLGGQVKFLLPAPRSSCTVSRSSFRLRMRRAPC
jgi:hypothetical protein